MRSLIVVILALSLVFASFGPLHAEEVEQAKAQPRPEDAADVHVQDKGAEAQPEANNEGQEKQAVTDVVPNTVQQAASHDDSGAAELPSEPHSTSHLCLLNSQCSTGVCF